MQLHVQDKKCSQDTPRSRLRRCTGMGTWSSHCGRGSPKKLRSDENLRVCDRKGVPKSRRPLPTVAGRRRPLPGVADRRRTITCYHIPVHTPQNETEGLGRPTRTPIPTPTPTPTPERQAQFTMVILLITSLSSLPLWLRSSVVEAHG